MLAAGVLSLFVSPMAWPLLVIYASLGLVVGLMLAGGGLAAILALAILALGVPTAATWLTQAAPEWYAAWWQPGVVALGAAALVYLIPLVIQRFRHAR